MKSVLVHTHFHKRRTGVTRSIENVLPFFLEEFETYIFGYNINGEKITSSELKKILFSDRKTIVHCHRNNEIIRMLYYRLLGGKFTLISTRHAESKPSGLTKFLLKKSDNVITLIKSMSDNLGVENTIVGHGVNVNNFIPDKSSVLKNITQENIILCAGRVRKAKGQIILLEAAKILKEHKNWALVIVGKVDKPPFLDELKSIAEKHAIKNQVYFIDETSEIIKYYQASHTVVVPSYSEGFSLVTAEAMSCGCNVIATKNVGVHSSLISNDKNGYLFDAGNILQLENLLSEVITNNKKHLGEEARDTIVKNWSAKKEAEKLMAVYNS